MAKVRAIKPTKPVDYVGYEPVMISVSKARAAQHLLEFLDSGHEGPLFSFKTRELERADDHVDWIRQFGHDALVAALDEVEAEYRKLDTNLLQKELADAARAGRLDPTPGDGA